MRWNERYLNKPEAMLLAVVAVVVLVIVGCQSDQKTDASGEQAARAVDLPPGYTDSVPSADGVLIHYDAYGEGDRTVLLVHGWACDASYWDGQIAALVEEGYRAVAVDLAGHGRSGPEREAWTMQAYGADVVAVADAVKAEEIALVGHSMGGAVVLEAAAMLGNRVKGVVGVDTFQDLEQSFTDEQIAGFMAPFEEDFKGQVKQFVRGMFPESADSTMVARVADDMAQTPKEVGLGSFRHLFAYDYAEVLAGLDIPILTIGSDKYPVHVEKNRKLYGKFDATVLDSTGHFLHMEKPSEFNHRLMQALRRLWLRPGETGRY
jgi:pimeloyl-ACP methyl ester carboxylesterase